MMKYLLFCCQCHLDTRKASEASGYRQEWVKTKKIYEKRRRGKKVQNFILEELEKHFKNLYKFSSYSVNLSIFNSLEYNRKFYLYEINVYNI